MTDKIPTVLTKLIDAAQQMDLFIIGMSYVKLMVPGVGPRFEEFVSTIESGKDLSQGEKNEYLFSIPADFRPPGNPLVWLRKVKIIFENIIF